MTQNTTLPNVVLDAFPYLSDALFSEQFILPDTTFDIFSKSPEELLALVTTDYPDPHYESLELRDLSGRHGLEFVNLIKPHSEMNNTIEIFEHDDMEGDFFVTAPYKTYRLYYYLANLKQTSK